jgi:aminomethyltransferase
VDDVLVHKVAEDHYFLCVNSSNQEKDFDHIQRLNRYDAEVEFASPRYAQIAIQGPNAIQTLQRLTDTELNLIQYYWFVDGVISGAPARIARTGYTGEDGFEIYIPPEEARRIWDDLMRAGSEFAIRPCGLGPRNTLRLESKMALYGHEIDASINPYEAGLGWIVKLDKGDFTGRDALVRHKENGVSRKLAGFEMRGRGIGRDGYEVLLDGSPAGWVTSGGPSPTLNKNIGLCYLPAARARAGEAIQIMIRNQPVEAVTVQTPFYVLVDIVYFDLPKIGAVIESGRSFGSVESVKAVSDIYAPISGEVNEVNSSLADAPEKLNQDPHGAAWLVKVKLSAPDEIKGLMSAADYQKYVGAET